MPSFLRRAIPRGSALWDLTKALIVQKPVTGLFGYRFHRSLRSIQILLTYDCNLRCKNCDILCRQAPSDERMTVAQIRKFAAESVERGTRWKYIGLMGGEPALHPELKDIITVLLKYKKSHAPECVIYIATNGYGDTVKKVLAELPHEIVVENTAKTGPDQLFNAFNLAPVDSKLYRFADYAAGCGFAHCGIALTPAGYYPCAASGGMDRVLGLDAGRKRLPPDDDGMRDIFRKFCQFCGHFAPRETMEELFSPTWIKLLEGYRKSKPGLTEY